MGERPFFAKQAYGDDPIRNTMYGLDADYRSDWPRLTKWLNKLPFYNSQEVSSISAYAEAAMLQPGHAPQIGKGNAGQIFIDDFEGTRSGIDLRFPLISRYCRKEVITTTPIRIIPLNYQSPKPGRYCNGKFFPSVQLILDKDY